MNTLIKQNCELNIELKELVDEFISPDSAQYRYAFGRNEHSEALTKAIQLKAIIDDYAPEGTIWNNLPVVKRADLPCNAIVVNCVLSISPVIVNRLLQEQKVKNFGLYALSQYYPEKFSAPDFVENTQNNYNQNKDRWQKVYDSLKDEKSKLTFNNVLNYRLSGNYDFMTDYSVNLKEQYFDDFLNLKDEEVFVDCGGFDGDTSEEFIKRCPNYKKIYFFEPSEENLINAKKRLNNETNIEFIEKGVSDKEECLNFSFEGSASGICSDGEFKIQTTTIDKFINDKITFIKMDLEGWELNALKGAEDHIKNDKPKLAIAVYHSAKDFYEIFEYIMSLNPDYNVYLRHYTQGWSETVMFFIPN